MPTVISPTRTNSLEKLPLLERLSTYMCENPQFKRDPLVMLGGSNNAIDNMDSGAGYFRAPVQRRDGMRMRVQSTETGKVESFIFYYAQRDVAADVLTSKPASVCVDGGTPPERNFKVDVSGSDFRGSRFTIKYDEWKSLIKDPTAVQMEYFMTKVNAALVALDTKLLTDVIGGQGGSVKNPANAAATIATISTYQQSELYDSATGAVLGGGYEALVENMQDNQFDQGCYPGVITQNSSGFSSFLRVQNHLCCNDSGFNAAGTANTLRMLPWRGFNVHQAFTDAGLTVGAGDFPSVVIQPGAAQLVEYWDSDHMGFMDSPHSMLVPWTDPISGERFDVRIEKEQCATGLEVNIMFYKQVKAVTMPLDMYKAGDRLENINGIQLFNFTKA